MKNGDFGENFCVEGLLEPDVCIGDIYSVGGSTVQVSQPRQPCWKLARRWQIKDLAAQVQETGRTGWYFRVLEEGEIEAPADLALIERSHGEWTIEKANALMHRDKEDLAGAARLAQCPALSDSWRASLRKRVETNSSGNEAGRLFGA